MTTSEGRILRHCNYNSQTECRVEPDGWTLGPVSGSGSYNARDFASPENIPLKTGSVTAADLARSVIAVPKAPANNAA